MTCENGADAPTDLKPRGFMVDLHAIACTVRNMTAQAKGVLFDCFIQAWMRQPLPSDIDELDAVIPGAKACWPQIRRFLVTDGAVLRFPLCEERYVVACQLLAKRKYAGSKGGSAKASAKHVPSTCQASAKQVSSTPSNLLSSSLVLSSSDTLICNNDSSRESKASLSPAANRKRSQPKDAIAWAPETGWTGITDADRAGWAAAYPACDIDRQLAAMAEWLRANPAKARKSAWRKFVANWLSRSQDKGGDIASNKTPKGQKVLTW